MNAALPIRSIHLLLLISFGFVLWGETPSARALPSDQPAAVEDLGLAAFSDATEEWGDGIEAMIEEAYRECFRTYIIDGRVLTLRMPFGQNNERSELADGDLAVQGGGKADPEALWSEIDALLHSADFRAYADALSDGSSKIVIYDLAKRGWSVTRDLFETARMQSGAYPGLPHRPYVFSSGGGIEAAEVYNYLYCVGRLGMDCSGFVWHVLSTAARGYGLNLAQTLRRALRAPQTSAAHLYFGTRFFEGSNPEVAKIKDEIRNLKPLDVIYFRGSDGDIVHSSVIQSIDRKAGRIRYLQSTDEAPVEERGVHESFIIFDPARPQLSLKDPSLVWTQKRLPPFEGERASSFVDDGERYRAFPESGGGGVARIKALDRAVSRVPVRR